MRLAALWCGASALVVRQQPTRRRLRIAPRMAVSEIAMPALSSTMTSGRVVSWLVGKGDKVEAGDPVMVVESDKADMEVESFEEGYVAAIVVDEGSDADVGVAVGYLAETAEEAPSQTQGVLTRPSEVEAAPEQSSTRSGKALETPKSQATK